MKQKHDHPNFYIPGNRAPTTDDQEKDERLLGIVMRTFAPNKAKNVLQVGLVALQELLHSKYRNILIPQYVTVRKSLIKITLALMIINDMVNGMSMM
jgi:hypothetical protein